jgi:hypothetical protein
MSCSSSRRVQRLLRLHALASSRAKQASLAADLRRFGEDAVAIKVESLSAVEIDSVHARGMKIAFAGTPLLKAVCLAAVQTVEGKARPLARKRRRAAT